MFFDIRQNEESARDYTTTILKRKNEGISKMADNRVIIFDTTLRDGEQALPQSLSMRQKLQIALALEELGVESLKQASLFRVRATLRAFRRLLKH